MTRWMTWAAAWLCTGCAAAGTGPGTPPASGRGEVTIVRRGEGPEGITEATLDNGLRVLVQEKSDVPVVSAYIWYRVGSANEHAGATGLAHYLEHLLFKGTDRYRKGEIDAITLKNGGSNNAFTWRDYTAYYFNFAADRWDVALQIEANRMRHTLFDPKEFASEKKVVIEELYRSLDRPTGRLERDMRVKLYGADHPYGHHTLGTEEDLNQRVGVDTVKAFYDRNYWPANATLVIVGAVDTGAVLQRIGELFGDIPPGDAAAAPSAGRPAPPGDARIERHEDVAIPRAIIEYPGTRVGEPDDFVLEVIARLLGGGVASRLHQRLVEREQLAVEASCWNASGSLPGSFQVAVSARAGADRSRIEAAVGEEMARLAAAPVPAQELDRARNQLIASFTFDKEKADERAYLIGMYEAHGDYRLIERYADAIAGVTAERVQAAAAKYFTPANRLTGWVLPKAAGEGGSGGGGAGGDRHDRPHRRPGCFRAPRQGAPIQPAALDVERYTLENGLRVRLLPRPGAGLAAVRAYVEADRRFEPAEKAGLAALHGELLRSGTTSRTALQIAETLEDVGGRLSTSSTGIAMKVLERDLDTALALAADLLQHSTIPEDEFAKKRAEQVDRIKARNDEPRALAYDAARALVYGGHPWGRPALGTTATAAALTRDDVAGWYHTRVVPPNTVLVVVGDFDPAAVKAQIAGLFGGWTGEAPPAVVLPAVTPQTEPRTRYLTRPDDAQLNIYLMRAGIRRDNPDWYKLLVMDYVLGMGPGFTDRLSKTLRDEQGLCYTVYARIAELADVEPGTFETYMGTGPANKTAALTGIRAQIARMRTERVSDEELTAAKAYLTGRFVFQFETREQLAAHIVNAERLGLPDDYLPRYAERVNAVTAGDVLAVAKQYLHPDDLSLAIAGRVDQNGAVLPKKE